MVLYHFSNMQDGSKGTFCCNGLHIVVCIIKFDFLFRFSSKMLPIVNKYMPFSLPALDEVGGVPADILMPVLERCTPQQLFHLEDCNPVSPYLVLFWIVTWTYIVEI